MLVNLEEHMHRRYVSFAVAQNWSMHVKYESRHALYPPEKAAVAVAVVALRPGFLTADWGFLTCALRTVVALRTAVRAVVFVVLRGVVAARAVGARTALRTDVVATRGATTVRAGALVVATRLTAAAVGARFAAVRTASPRTAASAKPTPNIVASAKIRIFLIPG